MCCAGSENLLHVVYLIHRECVYTGMSAACIRNVLPLLYGGIKVMQLHSWTDDQGTIHVMPSHMSDYPGLLKNFTLGSSGPDASQNVEQYRWACAAVVDASRMSGVDVQPDTTNLCHTVLANLTKSHVEENGENGAQGALMVYGGVPLTIAHRSPGFTYGFYPLGTLSPGAGGGGALPEGTIEKTLDLWNRRDNHLVPKSVDPNTQFDQRDDLYYAGMVPLNALAGRGDAALGNISQFLDTEQEATGCLPLGTKCPPCDRSIGADRRWNHCITPTAMYLETNNPVFEGPFMVANGLQEMLLFGAMGGTTLRPQPATLIKLFPAIPTAWAEAVFSKLRTEGAFVVSARLSQGLVEGFSITALSERTEVEIVASMRSGAELCVNGTRAQTLRRGADGLITGTVPEGATLLVHACGSAPPDTTSFLPATVSTGESNHYGYKP